MGFATVTGLVNAALMPGLAQQQALTVVNGIVQKQKKEPSRV
jgi:hypothetical protein